ncbi:MAG: DMT family transporter [Bryobacteraceae bacterium]
MTASRQTLADLSLVAVTVIWGAMFVVVQKAIEDASTLLFLAMRFGLATVVLAAVFRRRAWPSGWDDAGRGGVLAGVCLFAGFAFQTAGLRYTTPARSAFITGLAVVMVPLLGALVYRVWPRVFEIAGVIVAAAGMGLLTLQGEALRMSRGDALSLACAIAFAAQIVIVGHFCARGSFERLTMLQVGTAALIAGASFWWLEKPYLKPAASLWTAVVVAAVLATALAFAVQSWAQQYTSPTRAALIFAIEPVVAWLVSYWITDEALTIQAATGAALILAGVLTVELSRAPQTEPKP